jgi:hypothetical protein
MKEVDTIE